MPAYLLPDDQSSLIVSFDATLSEAHETTADVTEHPREAGPSVVDNVRPNPGTVSLEVYVSNHPITDLGGRGATEKLEIEFPVYEPPLEPTPGSLFRAAKSAAGALVDAITGGKPPVKLTVLTFPEVFDRVRETHETLEDLVSRGVTMAVITSTRTYEGMSLSRVSLPRDEPGGARFQLDFKRILTVTTETVAAPKPAEKRGAPAVAKGSQGNKPVNGKDASKATSLAFKALEALGVVNGG